MAFCRANPMNISRFPLNGENGIKPKRRRRLPPRGAFWRARSDFLPQKAPEEERLARSALGRAFFGARFVLGATRPRGAKPNAKTPPTPGRRPPSAQAARAQNPKARFARNFGD
jgi:hypothetical protein